MENCNCFDHEGVTSTSVEEYRTPPAEIRKWLSEFAECLNTSGPTKIANYLVQLGVQTEKTCSCEQDMEGLKFDPVFDWLHDCHKQYNSEVWMLIKECRPGIFQQLRKVLQKDLNGPDDFIGNNKLPEDVFGKIVLKTYGRVLLENFLSSTPNPDWVYPDLVDTYG